MAAPARLYKVESDIGFCYVNVLDIREVCVSDPASYDQVHWAVTIVGVGVPIAEFDNEADATAHANMWRDRVEAAH